MPTISPTRAALASALLLAAAAAQAQDACPHRGDLDTQFCDADVDSNFEEGTSATTHWRRRTSTSWPGSGRAR